MPNHKALSGVEFKDAGHGQVEAVFATLGVKDRDGDVTIKGAFDEGASCRISAYNHKSWEGALPIGKGTIHEQGDSVVFRGEFFKTQAAQDTREVLKSLGEDGAWSYGFDVVESEPGEFKGEKVRMLKRMRVHEVSPVMMGAGVGTRTTSIKSAEAETLADEVAMAVEAAVKAVERAERVEALRAEKGLELTDASVRCLEGLNDVLMKLGGFLNKDEINVKADDTTFLELSYMANEFREGYDNVQ